MTITSGRPLLADALASALGETATVAFNGDRPELAIVDIAGDEAAPEVNGVPVVLLSRGSAVWRRRKASQLAGSIVVSFDDDVSVLADLVAQFRHTRRFGDARGARRATLPAAHRASGPAVVVLDDRALSRTAIAAALGTGTAPVLTAPDLQHTLARTIAGDVAVVIATAGPPTLAACAALRRADRRVVIVADHDQPELLETAVEAGADAFVASSSGLADLRDAVAAASRGEAWVPAPLLGSLLRNLIDRRRASDVALARASRLSDRERAVLELLADGAGHEHIAAALFVSPSTVRTHLRNLYRKLGVHSRKEAVALVVEHDALARLAAAEGKLGA